MATRVDVKYEDGLKNGPASKGALPEKSVKKRKRVTKKKKKKVKQPRMVPVKHEEDEKPNTEMDEEVEYVSYVPNSSEDMAAFSAFQNIFAKFEAPEVLCLSKQEREQLEKQKEEEEEEIARKKAKKEAGSEDEKEDEEASNESTISKRERKKQKRLSVAVLKQLVNRPEVVEVWDVTAGDPALLVSLKSYRNSVPVPRHWCQKRKYLQGKRGIAKPPFELPEFIAATGISRIRQALQEEDEKKKLKQKQRERMQPKMGKLDIDYQVLHDAFFRHQTKPKLTQHGDTYYEGKEFEVRLKEKRPGLLSQDLKEALGMPEGAPPPWLINMQRYGPPPSYPNLRIPGLNAPIPPGASFGYHPGGWGKPPVDREGKPLYGDVFGTMSGGASGEFGGPVDRKHWGELEEEEYESEEEEESEEEGEGEGEEEGEEEGGEAPAAPAASFPGGVPDHGGLVTPTGIATPDHLVLRKKDVGAPQPPEEGRPLFQVLQQREAKVGGATFGSAHTYVLGGEEKAGGKPGRGEAVNLIKSQKTKEVAITLNPNELENLTDDMLKEKYEATVKATAQPEREDLSDLVAEHTKKKAKKDAAKDKKKYKEFKF
jgi:splicing factor 3B subunit 2